MNTFSLNFAAVCLCFLTVVVVIFCSDRFVLTLEDTALEFVVEVESIEFVSVDCKHLEEKEEEKDLEIISELVELEILFLLRTLCR